MTKIHNGGTDIESNLEGGEGRSSFKQGGQTRPLRRCGPGRVRPGEHVRPREHVRATGHRQGRSVPVGEAESRN